MMEANDTWAIPLTSTRTYGYSRRSIESMPRRHCLNDSRWGLNLASGLCAVEGEMRLRSAVD